MKQQVWNPKIVPDTPKLPMSDSEILRSYNQAKNKKEQIKILADLNATTPKTIKAVLTGLGCVLDTPDEHTKTQRKIWTAEEDAIVHQMYSEGKAISDIAQKLERTENAVKLRLWRLENDPSSPKPAAPKKSAPEEKAPKSPDIRTVSSVPDDVPDWVVSQVKVAITKCFDAEKAIYSENIHAAILKLGEIKQLLEKLNYDMSKGGEVRGMDQRARS